MNPRNMFADNARKENNGFNYRQDWKNQDVTRVNREQSLSPWECINPP